MTPHPPTTFAGLLAQAQARLELTQGGLANRIGTHRNTVMLYLSGQSLPPESRVARLCQDLGLDADLVATVLASERESRRCGCGIRIDTVPETVAVIDRLKSEAAADNLEAMIARHDQESDMDGGANPPVAAGISQQGEQP